MNYCAYCKQEIKDGGIFMGENGLLESFHEECFVQGLFDGVIKEERNTNSIGNA